MSGAKGAVKMISAETMTADTHFTLIHLLIGIHTLSQLRQPGVKSWHVSFHSIFPPLFPTFPWVQTVKWWIDSSGIGGSSKHPLAMVERCIQWVVINTPGLSTARIKQAITVVCLLDLAAQILAISCHCLSHRSIMETQTGIHAHRHFLAPYLILPPALSFQANTLPLCVRLTTETLSVAESLRLVLTVLSLCQSHPNASDACRACPLRAYACIVCAYVVLCLCMRMCVCVCASLTVSLLAHGWHHAVILPQYLKGMLLIAAVVDWKHCI